MEFIVSDYFPDLHYSNLLKSILYARGFDKKKTLEFLEEKFVLEDSSGIFGIKKAAKYILVAIEAKKKIVIHGDFDVDGVCASAIAFDYLYFKLGADIIPIIPNRADEGYGLSEKTIQKAIDFGAELILTVDCGIKDIELVDKYKAQIDFIITDHHQFSTDQKGNILLPKAKAVVHSAHPKSKFPCMISGAATAWQLMREIEKLRASYATVAKTNIDMDEYLDLVALSTVCDVIPLISENRRLVQSGLKHFAKTKRLGLIELAKIASVNLEKINSHHFGFVFGPRLNAPGRVTNDAMDSLRLLVTKKSQQSKELAQKLNELNLKRQEITEKYLEIAEKQIELNKKSIVIIGEEWPEGILGLIAGRLAEQYYKPTFVASIGENEQITGSSRSPLEDLYLIDVLMSAKSCLTRFGGHKSAAGFASETKIFTDFPFIVEDYISKNTKPEHFIRKINYDLIIEDLKQITIDEIEELSLLEPFGEGNRKPSFMLKQAKIINRRFFGKDQNHLMLELLLKNQIIKAKYFNFNPDLNLELNQIYDFIGSIEINEWNGSKEIELNINSVFNIEN
jgi:single-stranded-DNA-specific exonuclease